MTIAIGHDCDQLSYILPEENVFIEIQFLQIKLAKVQATSVELRREC